MAINSNLEFENEDLTNGTLKLFGIMIGLLFGLQFPCPFLGIEEIEDRPFTIGYIIQLHSQGPTYVQYYFP